MTYPRTPEIRAKNRANGRPGPCGADCTCRRHRVQVGRPGRKCAPDCTCGRHNRTREHNARIGISVALTREANQYA